VLRAADQIPRPFGLPRRQVTFSAPSMIEKALEEAEDEPLFCERPRRSNRQAGGGRSRPGAARDHGGAAGAGDPGVRHSGGSCWRMADCCGTAGWSGPDGKAPAILEAGSSCWKQQGFDCARYQASRVKALHGRPKTDKLEGSRPGWRR